MNSSNFRPSPRLDLVNPQEGLCSDVSSVPSKCWWYIVLLKQVLVYVSTISPPNILQKKMHFLSPDILSTDI